MVATELETAEMQDTDVMTADSRTDASEQLRDFTSAAQSAADRTLSPDSRTFLSQARQPRGE